MGETWTREELVASVEAYLAMQRQLRSGEQLNKTQYYRDLSARFARTAKAFEYRMQNISVVKSEG